MMKNLIAVIIFCFLFIGGVYAQKTAPKINSVYTNLNKDCKTVGGGDGQDEAINCKGVGGYRIFTSLAAALLQILVDPPDRKESILLISQGYDYNTNRRSVEWRTANGKPFAVILRVNKYGDPDDNNPYIGKKIGEELIVRGLKGFDFSFEVDVKTPNANVKARELADKAYLDLKSK